MAIETIKNFNFSNKKYIIRQIVEGVVADKRLVVVGGHIQLTGLRMELCHEDRHRRTAQRWQINFI